jgi:hypothetical protein
VKGKVLMVTHDDSAVVDSVGFVFDSFGFVNLKAALVEKYPDSKCVTSEVVTRLGLRVPQMICRYETATDGIYLMRAAGNINRSQLFLMSAEKRQEVQNRISSANKDL